MVRLLAYFAPGRNYPMIRMMKSDDIIKNGYPLPYFASGANFSMIMMMISECFPSCLFYKWGELTNDQDDEVGSFTRLGRIGLKYIYPWGRGGRLMR